jgi:16S rRNA (guanine966-N2)-methyltransferase
MRIVSGKYRGRRLTPPANLPVRPTTDFAKEGLFNVLNNLVDFEALRVLDLFAGTGSISFEFISRGAVEVTAVDNNFRCTDFIRKTAAVFGADNLKVIKSNAFVVIKHAPGGYDLIFADPPYDLEGIDLIPGLIMEAGLLAPDGLLVLEHAARYDFSEHPHFDSARHYGSVNFSFFR